VIIARVDRVLDALLFGVLAAMAGIVAANVFCRFVLHFSIYWGDEAAQALLVWLTFLGAAVAVRERAHYAFDYLATHSRGTLQLAIGVTSRVCALLIMLAFLYWSARVTWGIRPWTMPAMGISRAYVYAAGPVGAAFMLLYAVRDLARLIREHRVSMRPVTAT
jgi:TRAP-type transport system small permease protein